MTKILFRLFFFLLLSFVITFFVGGCVYILYSCCISVIRCPISDFHLFLMYNCFLYYARKKNQLFQLLLFEMSTQYYFSVVVLYVQTSSLFGIQIRWSSLQMDRSICAQTDQCESSKRNPQNGLHLQSNRFVYIIFQLG